MENYTFNSSTDVQNFRKRLEVKINDVIDTYHSLNTDENITDLQYNVAAIYLAMKKVSPKNVHFRISFRVKGERSEQKNIEKEFENTSSTIQKDIYAMRIIVDKIDGQLPDIADSVIGNNLDEKLLYTLSLEKTKTRNIEFINSTRDFLNNPLEPKTEEDYYNKMITLLTLLKDSTYSECIYENGDDESYFSKYASIQEAFRRKKIDNSFALKISPKQIKELHYFLDSLEERSNDKLESALLEAYLPKALNSHLIANTLQMKYDFEKTSIKKDGYVAEFYILHTPDYNIELQSQSSYRYQVGVAGTAFHNGLEGKQINIFDLFELTNPDDNKPLNYYLKFLDNVPFSEYENELIDGPEDGKSSIVEQVDNILKHIKLKNKFVMGNTSYKMDKYLELFANYVSPKMYTCRSARDLSTPTVYITEKSLTSNLSDVLRRRDGISFLANIIIDRLKTLGFDKDITISLTTNDIVKYAKAKEQNKAKSKVDEVLDDKAPEI